MIANLRAELARLKETNSQTASPTVNNTVADNHSLDAFISTSKTNSGAANNS